MAFSYIRPEGQKFGIKAWDHGVPFDRNTYEQLGAVANMPFIHKHVAAMPDAHFGRGATVGSVIATKGAIIPAAVGVDLGCGMMAYQTTLTASDLPDNLADLRSRLERAIPVGMNSVQGRSRKGSWLVTPKSVDTRLRKLSDRLDLLVQKHPKIAKNRAHLQLGTLGGGNHFIEICLDENQDVWVMLHSGSRGIGNMIGMYFIEKAKEDMRKHFINLPDKDLSYLTEGTDHFDEYIEALSWAQDYARENREAMMDIVLNTMREVLPPFKLGETAVNCHHNYAEKENHFGENVWVTRKGAVRARKGDLGIIPGSMGTGSFIVEGLGNEDAFCSCSHGAGRVMSRTAAKKLITLEDHIAATEGIECRKDQGVVDESPAAYKDINAVMAAQNDLVQIRYRIKQVLNIKG